MGDTVDWLRNGNDMADAALAAVLFYALIVAAVRLFGKRSTAQLNNFDWIINITVGALAASGILLDSVPVLRAATAIVTLMALQFVLTWLTLRFEWVGRLIKTMPTLLMHEGRFLEGSMRRVRVSREEIQSVLRKQGIADAEGASWVILESNGRLAVIPRGDLALKDASAMRDVGRPADLDAADPDSESAGG